MEGTRISHYELRSLLGRGGMGEVYEALDLKTRRAVAIKFLAPELASEPMALKRFESEAVNAAALNHPHIATLFEFEPEGARPFIAMELVTGASLRGRIEQGPLEIPEALAIARDVAAALAYAHRRGIVHRDIKPENLMFDDEGRVKVMDFGLARALHGSRLTMTSTSMGTPSYMSPEAIAGNAGMPSDVFALGLVLEEMITGVMVFAGDNPLSVMFAIANVEPPPLRERRLDVPEPVEQLARRMIEKNPDQRPDAASVARELSDLTGTKAPPIETDSRAMSPPVLPDVRRTGSDSSLSAATPVAEAIPPRPRRRVAALVFTSLLVVLVLGGLWMLRAGAAARARQQQEAVLLNNRAWAAWRSGNFDEAQRFVTAALSLAPRYGEALLNRAAIYDSRGQLDSAAAVYTSMLQTFPKDSTYLLSMALFNLGDIDLRGGAPLQAAKHWAQSFSYDSSRWEIYNNLGYAWVQAGRPGEALPVLTRGMARFSGAAPLYKNAARAFLAMDLDSEALVQLDRALSRDPGMVDALGLRARLRARRGDPSGALADWRLYARSSPPPNPQERSVVERELVQHGVALDLGSPPSR